MDSFSTQKTKSRKMKRLAKKSRVQIILDLFFRAMEIIVVLVTVGKLCYELVTTFEDSGVAAVILANRSLAFVVGNAIVIALIAKSGLLLNQEPEKKTKQIIYEKRVKQSKPTKQVGESKGFREEFLWKIEEIRDGCIF